MKRENRANLLFLAVFLGLTLPGIVILFRRRMRSEAPPLMFPDAMSHRLAYMTPPPAPPDATWVVPPLTRAWLDGLVHARCGASGARYAADPRGEPVPLISDDRAIQCVWSDLSPASPRVALVQWRDPGAEPARFVISCREPGQGVAESLPVHVDRQEVVAMPQDVRAELMAAGYLRPPKHIVWLDVSLPAKGNPAPQLQLNIQYPGPAGTIATSVKPFTK